MKKVIDNSGNEIMVADNVVVNTINGVNYLLTPAQQVEYDTRNVLWAEDAIPRANGFILQKRRNEYGSAEEQLEYAIEYGWDALVKKNKAINEANPFISEKSPNEEISTTID